MRSDQSIPWADLAVGRDSYRIVSLPKAEADGLTGVAALPRCLKVLLESNLRHLGQGMVSGQTLSVFTDWLKNGRASEEIAFYPARVMMPDSSGIPVLCDLAAMRDAMQEQGRDPGLVNPVRPVDLIMDHSVQAIHAGRSDAARLNVIEEYRQNEERYAVAKWAQKAFANLRVVPPGQGICHQINLEYLARVVWTEPGPDGMVAFPDSLVGGDSHTTMINALAVLGWGVGGIEAMSALLGEPVGIQLPEVVGVRLVGALAPGVTATDLVLTLTQRLRALGVTQKFVEFSGPSVAGLPVPTRATIANMCPEYGASCAFFGVDERTLQYLKDTDRADQVALVEAYARHQGLWMDDTRLTYTEVMEVDLSSVTASVAGPDLPHRLVSLPDAAGVARDTLGSGAEGRSGEMRGGDLAIAAITSCTNTSNPEVMLTAGLLARNAVARGLKVGPGVKTSLSPGSRVVVDYLRTTGLMEPLKELGFAVTGFGCMTCGGGSGDLNPVASEAAAAGVPLTAILSGNRNFTGRVHPQVANAYLASPPLVVAFALAGTMLTDVSQDPIGTDRDGRPVMLSDIWPDMGEVAAMMPAAFDRKNFARRYGDVEDGGDLWEAIEAGSAPTFDWNPDSQLIQKPPFLQTARPLSVRPPVTDAAILAVFGDFLTTDHISPGGYITSGTNVAEYLAGKGIVRGDLGTFVQRRCNPDVMVRGTFNNTRIENLMLPGTQGGKTLHQPDGTQMWIEEAAARYRSEGRAMVVVAGKGYGAGSSRDWAAKGPHLLGVDAVLAEGFERIHRSNLVGMGIAPLQMAEGTREALALTGAETVDLPGLENGVAIGAQLVARITYSDGSVREVPVTLRIDTESEMAWFRAGGLMPHVLRRFAGAVPRNSLEETT